MPKHKIKILTPVRGYDLAAVNYDNKEKYLNSFEKGRIIDMLGDARGKTILDVGAGTGRLASTLVKAGSKVIALDLSAKMLFRLKKKSPQVETVIGEAENLPFAGNSFDIVIAAFLIVHLKEPKRFFDEAHRVLKDGGILAVTNINQKEPPVIETEQGKIRIESYYHRPQKVREDIVALAFDIKQEEIIEEKGVWISQIIIAQK